MPYKIYKQMERDRKKRKKRYGMQVDNRSIFTIVGATVRKAKKGRKNEKKNKKGE